MAWPQQSNFQSGRPIDAYFFVAQSDRADGAVQVCATQGRSLIRAVQRKLNAAGGLGRGRLAIDGAWGSDTNRELINAANQLMQRAASSDDQAEFREVQNQLLSGERARNISRVMLRFAIYVAHYVGDNWSTAVPFRRVSVPLSAILPRWGSAPDDDRNVGGGALTCWDRDRDRPPEPLPGGTSDVDRARREGETGLARPPERGGGGGAAAAGGGGSSSSGGGGGGGGAIAVIALLLLAAAAGGSSRKGGGGGGGRQGRRRR